MLSREKAKDLQRQRDELVPEHPAVARALLVLENHYGRLEDQHGATARDLEQALQGVRPGEINGRYAGLEYLHAQAQQRDQRPATNEQTVIDAISQAVKAKQGERDDNDEDEPTR